jgi:hypothetical protein
VCSPFPRRYWTIKLSSPVEKKIRVSWSRPKNLGRSWLLFIGRKPSDSWPPDHPHKFCRWFLPSFLLAIRERLGTAAVGPWRCSSIFTISCPDRRCLSIGIDHNNHTHTHTHTTGHPLRPPEESKRMLFLHGHHQRSHQSVLKSLSLFSLHTYFCLATTFQNRHQRIVESDKSERSRKTTKMKMRNKTKRSSSVLRLSTR